MPEAPKVFITYSHDSDAHETHVLELANRLREDGIDVEIDQYETSPAEGWPTWCEQKIKQADFVLLVCTETYLHRFDDADPGEGQGVLWEARNIRQLIYDDRAKTGKYIPVLFDGGSSDHIPTPVKGATRWQLDKAAGYEGLYRQLTRQPRVLKPVLGTIKPMPPKEVRSGSTAANAPAPLALPLPPARPAGGDGAPHPRAGEVFVGRGPQLAVLAACVLPGEPAKRRPVAVMGMAGVGKSYLVDRFFIENGRHFPGGYHRLTLDAEKPGTAAELLATLADRLKLPAAAADEEVAMALCARLALVHVENVDTDEAAAMVGELDARLRGCALVLSARMRTLAAGTGWGAAKLAAFDERDALAQFRQELGEAVPDDEALRPIIGALGGLPLALHLAAGHLQAGETPQSFLNLLRRQGLSLAPINLADPSFRERSRTRLEAVFVLSLAALERAAEACGRPAEAWIAAFHALGYGPAAGVGESLGAAIAGLAEDDFSDLARTACGLSLLDRVPREGSPAFRLHPLLAELGRSQAPRDATIARITDWFCERLPEPDTGEAWRWNEVHAEMAALLEWQPLVPAADRLRVERAGSWMAMSTGPFHAWRRFCETALADATDDAQRSQVLWTLGNLAQSSGDLDAALVYAEQKRDLDRRNGWERNAALAFGLIADILYQRGDLDEALRLRTEEQLPVYERLGDVRERAVTMGKIADILYQRGDLDEALRFRTQEELPVYERLGDVRSRAVTMGKIADILYQRGDLDEALRLRTEEELPVYERLGDVRSRAVTMGKIADILYQRGDLDEALRLRTEEQLPVYERLGDVRSRAVTMGKIADILYQRGDLDEALRLRTEEELPVYERLGDVRSRAVTMGKIADILYQRGDLDEALRLRTEEELPVYERLGDVRERAVTMGKIADILYQRGDLDEALRLRTEEELPVYERLGDVRERAVTMGKIADILYQRGDLDEALRLLREELLPAFERLGDVRSRAVTMGKIADILSGRGELDEALRLRTEEELPVYERLGDVRGLLVGRANISIMLLTRNNARDRSEANRLLCLALADARRLRIPEAAQIEQILEARGLSCD